VEGGHIWIRVMSILILASLGAMQLTRNLTDIWLAHWVTKSQENTTQPNISKLYTPFRSDSLLLIALVFLSCRILH
jgi:hypothetical protein